jgi:hypothetical protein
MFLKTKDGKLMPTYASDPRGIATTMADMEPSLLIAPPV